MHPGHYILESNKNWIKQLARNLSSQEGHFRKLTNWCFHLSTKLNNWHKLGFIFITQLDTEKLVKLETLKTASNHHKLLIELSK